MDINIEVEDKYMWWVYLLAWLLGFITAELLSIVYSDKMPADHR